MRENERKKEIRKDCERDREERDRKNRESERERKSRVKSVQAITKALEKALLSLKFFRTIESLFQLGLCPLFTQSMGGWGNMGSGQS